MNKKGQFPVLYSRQLLLIVGGALVGYAISGNFGWDRNVGMVVGGIVGLIASTRF